MKTLSQRFRAIISGTAVVRLACVAVLFSLWAAPADAVLINEIHYDNSGADSGEGVELAGAAGQDLAGWSLVFYNGRADRRAPYATYLLAGVFSDMQNGFGVMAFDNLGFSIQNGSPDAVALVDANDVVVQFLGYEGSFIAASGVAAGLASTDIGVEESSLTPVGYSLQLMGDGRSYADFDWAAAPGTFGAINPGQSFLPTQPSPLRASSPLTVAIPSPASLPLFVLGLWVLLMLRRHTRTGHLSPSPSGAPLNASMPA